MKRPPRYQLALRAAWHILTGRPFVLALRERDSIAVDIGMPAESVDSVADSLRGHSELRRFQAHADALQRYAGMVPAQS